ncbi:hypothetical protein CEE45_15340 [Candidatus Heimdallarchaeota archaeon B3_Heim]|nr:MAG: hypothetical protein CEE45_15340 [Candidatus Heimdallarchaeota archaeon B3_Heim]
MIAGIILAAGESRRFPTQNKLLYEFVPGMSILESVLLAFLQSEINKIVIVTGHDSLNIIEKINILSSRHQTPVSTVFNDNYQSGGMSSSIITGLKAVINADAVLITPADIPLIPTSVINAMISFCLHDSHDIIIPTFNQRKGHPILLKSTLFPEILLISEKHRGLKEITTKHRKEIVYLPMQESGILNDLDTIKDLKKFSETPNPIGKNSL